MNDILKKRIEYAPKTWIDRLAAMLRLAALLEQARQYNNKTKKDNKNMEQTFETINGSHNSMSYLPPRRWWHMLMLPFARCQSKTIDEQLAAGARCFDMRISFDHDGIASFLHGWCRFGGDETITGVLERLQRHGEPIYVRLILEEPLTLWNTVKKALGLKATQKPDAANEYYFPRRCALYQKTYRGITFLGGRRKYDWSQLYDFGTDGIPMHQHVSSMDLAAPWWQRLLPWLYARKYSEYYRGMAQPGINLYDFI